MSVLVPLDREPCTAALVAGLAAATGCLVGKSEIPTGDGNPPPMPYYVLRSVPGGGYDGAPFVAPEEISTLAYSISAVGETAQQAEWAADRARRYFLGADNETGAYATEITVEVDGDEVMTVARRRPLGAPGGVEKQGPLFVSVEEFLLDVTPI